MNHDPGVVGIVVRRDAVERTKASRNDVDRPRAAFTM